MNVFNQPSYDQMEEQISILREMAGKIGVVDTLSSWNDLVAILRRKEATRYLNVGDTLLSHYNGVRAVVDVIGINHDVDEGDTGDTLTIQFRDCLLNGQIDAPEALYYASADVSPGKKVFEVDNGKYEFTTTTLVPQGGQIYISAWGEGYLPLKVITYAADRVTVIESDITVATSTGTANLNPVNHQQRCRYGSNNYKESAIRQWLNSDKETFTWTPQTDFDRPPSYPVSGFLKLLQPELASVIVATEKQVARNTITDGGGQDTFADKVFLLSRVEIGQGTEGDTAGETVYEFWDASTDADRIKVLGYSPRAWWLRSPHVGNASSVRSVGTTGVLINYLALYALGLSPACKIS